MANEKPIPDSGINLNSINGIINVISAAFSVPEPPIEPLPPQLVMVGAKLRPGLSAQGIAADIISKQSNAGRPVGDVFADGPNVEEAMELIRVQEIVNYLLTNAKIEVVLPPGIQVVSVGIGNLGAPVFSFGSTTTMGIADGVIR
jgi:urease gamma subunit